MDDRELSNQNAIRLCTEAERLHARLQDAYVRMALLQLVASRRAWSASTKGLSQPFRADFPQRHTA